MAAKFFIVGAGPGAADLLTIRAANAIANADVILYDRLVNREILELSNDKAEIINVGKLPGEQDSGQAKIYELFIKLSRTEKNIVRLKGGDPHVFGRGLEESLFIKELNCPVEYIPGISSAIALPGFCGIPLTARGVSQAFTVVTGQGQENSSIDWRLYAGVETLVILMGVQARHEIATRLVELGRSPLEPCCFVESGTRENQRNVFSTLGDIASHKCEVKSPAVWIIGKVVSFALPAELSNSLADIKQYVDNSLLLENQ